MPGKRYILAVDDSQYELGKRSISTVADVRGLEGDRMVFSDFEGAVPQVATVQTAARFARAVLEKQLRESGEIESGGRVIVLLKRARGQQTTELLYIAAPPAVTLERQLERDHGEHEYLVFPVQRLLADGLASARPRRPTAFMLIGERQVDVVVADRRVLYGAFRVSAPRTGVDPERLTRNLEHALHGLEQDYNIEIDAFQCLHLLTPAAVDWSWIGAVAEARNIGCRFARTAELDIDGVPYLSSVLGRLRGMKAVDSCSPRDAINNYRANEALPWAATAALACCALALFYLVEHNARAERVAGEIDALSSSLSARLAERPDPAPDYQPYLDTAARLAYARSIPTLREVLADVSGAARDRATALSEVEVEYLDDSVVVVLRGRTEKSAGADSMAFYNRFIATLRQDGYVLSESELDTDTRLIEFSTRLERRVDGGSA